MIVHHPQTVVVKDVHEANSVSGVKHIWITAERGADESYSPQFRLTTSWIFPEQKLQLCTVTPGDVVEVVWNYFSGDLGIMGDFTRIVSTLGHRQAYCQCLHLLVSNGYQTICPNKQCPLTLAARLERLSHLKFVPADQEAFWPPNFNHLDNVEEWGDNRYARPFSAITHGLFWGEPGHDLSTILERHSKESIGLETFMVESTFGEWVYNTPQLNNSTRLKSLPIIDQFHGSVTELFQRRDTSISRQNLLMFEWLWCLGLDALTKETIDRLVYHERNFSDSLEPIVFYAYMLTHANELVGEMGLSSYEVQSLLGEIRSRRLELFDLFKHYCTPAGYADLTKCFEDLG